MNQLWRTLYSKNAKRDDGEVVLVRYENIITCYKCGDKKYKFFKIKMKEVKMEMVLRENGPMTGYQNIRADAVSIKSRRKR